MKQSLKERIVAAMTAGMTEEEFIINDLQKEMGIPKEVASLILGDVLASMVIERETLRNSEAPRIIES